MVIDDTGSVEGIDAFIYCTKWRSGQVSRMPYRLSHYLRPHSQTLKDRATPLLVNYKSLALVTQLFPYHYTVLPYARQVSEGVIPNLFFCFTKFVCPILSITWVIKYPTKYALST